MQRKFETVSAPRHRSRQMTRKLLAEFELPAKKPPPLPKPEAGVGRGGNAAKYRHGRE